MRVARLLSLSLVLATVPGLLGAKETDQHIQRRGMDLLRESYRAEAEGRLGDALRIAGQMPSDPFTIFRQGKLLLKLGQLRDASGALIAAARADPHIPSLLSYVAYVQWKLGDAGASARTCASALNISLVDFRALALLQALPAPDRQPHVDILAKAEAAAAVAHMRGGHAHAREQNKTCGIKFRKTARSLTMVSSANSLYFQVYMLIPSLLLCTYMSHK
jgi:predicted Zn-dependent protease